MTPSAVPDTGIAAVARPAVPWHRPQTAAGETP